MGLSAYLGSLVRNRSLLKDLLNVKTLKLTAISNEFQRRETILLGLRPPRPSRRPPRARETQSRDRRVEVVAVIATVHHHFTKM